MPNPDLPDVGTSGALIEDIVVLWREGVAYDAALSELPSVIALDSGTTPLPLADLVTFDIRFYGAQCDGVTDDGPAIQRAVNAATAAGGGIISFPAATILWNTAVTCSGALVFRGINGPANASASNGTTLKTTNTAITPLTFTGVAVGNGFQCDGAVVENLTLQQAHPAPGAGWAPTVYPPFFSNVGAPGVHYRRIVGHGIYAGISNTGNSGRFEAREISGQFFSYAVYDDGSLDNNTMVDFHVWPYWSSDPNVITWQQSNTDVVQFGRSDGPFMDRIFVFAARSAIRCDVTGSGVVSKLQIGSLCTDSVRNALWVSSGTNITTQIANLCHQGQVGVSGGTALTGSSAILVSATGAAVFQIGNMESEFDDQSVVVFNNTTQRSILHLQSAYVRTISGGGTSSLFFAVGTGSNLPHEIHIGVVPVVAPAAYLPFLNYLSSNAIMQVPGVDTQVVYGVINPNAGGYAITNALPNLFLESNTGTTVASVYVALPSNPFEGMTCSIMANVNITTLNVTAVDSGSIGGAPTGLTAYQRVPFKYIYQSGTFNWVRIG